MGVTHAETHVLVNNGECYEGKYVAIKSFIDKEVISSGENPVSVTEEANKKGVENPVVFFIPEKDVSQIY